MDFASDNWAGATPAVMAAVTRHNGGAVPAYGDDALTAAVTRRFCEVFETELEVHFVATGTAANALSMAALARPGGLVFCSDLAHVHTSEYGATEAMTGMKLVPVLSSEAGLLGAAALRASLARYPDNGRHGPAVALSLTNAGERGTVYGPAEVAELAAVARGRGMGVHLDGARFGNAVAATGASPADLTWRAGVDIMSFGGTKNGCLGAEAILVFAPGRFPELTMLRQRAGQVMSKARFIAAQFETYLEDDAWIATATHANAMAARLAEGLRARGVRLAWEGTANEVFPVVSRPTAQRLREAGARFHEWPADGLATGETCLRLVTSWATTAAEVDVFVEHVGAC